MRIEGAPRYHISTLLQTPPAFLVLSSHAYSALGRFLILKDTFVAVRNFCILLYSSNAFSFVFALVTTKSHWFSWLEVKFFVLRTTIWLQVEEFATTEFNWLKKCTLHFQNSVGSSRSLIKANQKRCLFSDCIVPMKTRCWCQISTIRTSACRCSGLKIMCMLGSVIVRKYNERIF